MSFACPRASRCLALIALKGLEHVVEVIHVLPTWAGTKPGTDEHRGWVFRARAANAVEAAWDEVPLRDPLFGADTLRGVYEACEPASALAKFTVPLLVDKVTCRAVCNESSLIIRDLNGSFNGPGLARFPGVDLYPEALRSHIDAVNEEMYDALNNGVYRCGFATSQGAYDEAAAALAAALDSFDARLSTRRFLVGPCLTEADLRLFVTLVRYDPVYVVHFKTAFRMLRHDCPALLGFIRDVHQAAGGAGGAAVGTTVRLDHIKRHYFGSHPKINAYGIIPAPHPAEGVELQQLHGREGLP